MTVPAAKRSFGLHDLAEFRARIAELREDLNPPEAAGDFVAYTDGACFGNPAGPGGWAAAVIRPEGGTPWLLYGHLSSTSNNRAEALGVLGAVEWVPPGSRLEVHSDSEITVRILEGRYKVKANPDVWAVLRGSIEEKHVTVVPEWVRGHAGDPLNELADRLSKLGVIDGQIAELETLALETPAPREQPSELVGLEPRGDWERDFLKSVADQLRRRRVLSPKQQAIIDKIRARGPAA